MTIDERVDLLTVYIDKTLPVDEKSRDFLRQVKDYRHYKVGGVEVDAIFPGDAPKLAKGYKRLKA